MLEDAAVGLLTDARPVEVLAGILLGLMGVVAAVAAMTVAREEEFAELLRQVAAETELDSKASSGSSVSKLDV